MGEGLVGKTLGQLGMGNIGAEVFRLAQPFGMRFVAHDPYQDPAVAAELGVELVGLEELFRRADFLSVSVPLSEATRHRRRAPARADEADRLPDQHRPRPHRGPAGAPCALAGGGSPAPASTCSRPSRARRRADPEARQRHRPPHALCWTDECFAGNGAADVRAVLEVRGQVPVGVVNREVIDQGTWRAKLKALRPLGR